MNEQQCSSVLSGDISTHDMIMIKSVCHNVIYIGKSGKLTTIMWVRVRTILLLACKSLYIASTILLHARTHTPTHTYTHTHTQIHKYTHTHTHTHQNSTPATTQFCVCQGCVQRIYTTKTLKQKDGLRFERAGISLLS